MIKYFAKVGAVVLLAGYAAQANAATIVPIGTLPPAAAYSYITGATAGDRYVTANFGDTLSGQTTFDDKFQFTLPLNGVGSGSVSTSFSSIATYLAITGVIINNVSYTPAKAAAGISGIPITEGVLNTIEVMGYTTKDNVLATYSGTTTFSAVPEPTTWVSFLLGFGFMGLALRRKLLPRFAAA